MPRTGLALRLSFLWLALALGLQATTGLRLVTLQSPWTWLWGEPVVKDWLTSWAALEAPSPQRMCLSVGARSQRQQHLPYLRDHWGNSAGDSKTGQWLLTLHVMYQHPSPICTGFGLSLHPEIPTYTAEYSHPHSHGMKMNKSGVSWSLIETIAYSYKISIKTTK